MKISGANKGPIITAVISVLAMSAVGYSFMNGASKYVTVTEAKHSSDDRLHLAGAVIQESVQLDNASHHLLFKLKDSEGTVVNVVHTGDMPSDLSKAKTVVAIGGMKGDEFVSKQLLVKCPSKYDSESKK